MTGVQTCALPICFPVTILRVTDQVFGLTQILGFKFAPRIRNIADLKLYCFGKASDYPKIEGILNGKINTKVIEENYDDVLRLAHSIREGVVTASLIMGKIGSYSRQNNTATALKEMGKIEEELDERLEFFQKENKLVEHQRLKQRVEFDLEMIEGTGICKGIS